LLAHGRWFSPGTPASSTTKTGRHDLAEILLKVALNTINQSLKDLQKSLIINISYADIGCEPVRYHYTATLYTYLLEVKEGYYVTWL